MEVLRDLRPLGRLTLVCAALATIATLATLTAPAAEAQRRGGTAPAAPAAPSQNWPVKTREHVDLWLHGFALVMEDTATVPFFERGYADRVTVLKNSRAIYTTLDERRDELARVGAERGHLLNAQFLAMYFGSWDELGQAIQYFIRAEGDPRRSNNREIQGIIAFLAQQFPRAEDRSWLQRFVEGLTDERAKFHREWWLAEFRAREAALAAADSLWQREWRPELQRFLNYTQQPSGDLILSLPLGGEGRSIPAGKTANQFAVTFPATPADAETMLFAFAHEAAGVIARPAVNDHLTPAQQRAGLGARYSSAGMVRGGALIVERLGADVAERYAAYYLRQMGREVPAGGALAALAEAFPMPDDMIESMRRQIALSFTGI